MRPCKRKKQEAADWMETGAFPVGVSQCKEEAQDHRQEGLEGTMPRHLIHPLAQGRITLN